jgi:uncharacterized protein
MTTDPEPDSPISTSPDGPLASNSRSGHPVFIGPNGIRSGWRLLMFIIFLFVIGVAVQEILTHIPFILREFPRGTPGEPMEMTPGRGIFGEGLMFLCLLISVLIMSRIEKRAFADYGLPGRQFLGKRFWQGVPYGFVMLSVLLLGIGTFHGFTLGSIELSRNTAIHYGVLYGVVFLLVGLFEEFSFRGYMQFTLASGIGFWPAAIMLSIVFGGIHLGNSGEAILGAVMAGSFGIVAAFALYRTGNLWFPIGMHAGWDWGETYFYGVPDSGMLAKGHLYSATLHGPSWLTGGTVGPEGSYMALVVLVLGAVGIHFLFPAKERELRRGT